MISGKIEPDRRRLTVVALGLSAIFVLAVAIMLRAILTPVIIALVIAYIADPLLSRLAVHHVRRWVATTILYALALTLFTVAGATLGPTLWDQAQRLYRNVAGLAQDYRSSMQPSDEQDGGGPPSTAARGTTRRGGSEPSSAAGAAGGTNTQFNNRSPVADGFSEDLADAVQRVMTNSLPEQGDGMRDYLLNHADDIATRVAGVAVTLVQHAARGLSNAAAFVFGLILVLIFTFFFMLHFRTMVGTVKRYLPTAHRDRILHILSRIDAAVSNFFRGRLLVCFISGVVYVVGLRLAGIDFWLLFGIAGGVLSFIPIVGVILPMIPACAFALLTGHPWASLLGVLVTFSVVQWVVEPVANTVVLSHQIKLHPVSIILALLIGGSLFGMFGIILSVPLAAVVKILAEEFVLPPLRTMAGDEAGPANEPT